MELQRLMSIVLFQGSDAAGTDHMQLIAYSVLVIAFCSFIQFLVVVGAAIAGLRAYKAATSELNLLKGKAMPLVASVQTIVNDATPKVKTVTANVVQVSEFVKSKLQEYEGTIDEANQTLKDVNLKTRQQVDRVDGMIASTLKATSDIGTTVHRGIRAPITEVAGVVGGLKAALNVLAGRTGDGFSNRSASTRSFGSSEGQRRPASGPIPVAPGRQPESHPSSNVAPSPGAAAVVDQFRSEKIKSEY